MTYFDGERFIVRANSKYAVYNWFPKTNKLIVADTVTKHTIDQIIDWSNTSVVTGHKFITVIFKADILS
jgi:hypothetical protein